MAGIWGHGTTFAIGGDTIAELTAITGPSVAVDPIDVTTHDSADHYREFVAGLKDGGELTIEGNFITAAQANYLQANVNSGTVETCVITFTGPITWTFSAFVTALETSSPHDDKRSFTATLKVTGKPVLA